MFLTSCSKDQVDLIHQPDNEAAFQKSGNSIEPGTATNSSGFSAVPTGERSEAGVFDGRSLRTRWWTALADLSVRRVKGK